MRRLHFFAVFGLVLSAQGCGSDEPGEAPIEGDAEVDSMVTDVGGDSFVADTTVADTTVADTTSADSGTDTSTSDTATADVGGDTQPIDSTMAEDSADGATADDTMDGATADDTMDGATADDTMDGATADTADAAGPDTLDSAPQDTRPQCTALESLCPAVDPAAEYCANLQTSATSCGSCGNACGDGKVCTAGKCKQGPLVVTNSGVMPFNLSTINSLNHPCATGGDMVSYSVTALTATTATLSVATTAFCLAVGDEILLMNMQGVSATDPNVGAWETLKVASVSGTTVTFQSAKKKFYGSTPTNDSGIGTARTDQRVILQRVPEYSSLTVTSTGVLTGNAWDGVKGGVFMVRVAGDATVDGVITMKGKGYAGGATTVAASTIGEQGETFRGLGARARTAFGGGGGGGAGDGVGGCTAGFSGAGGGYGTAGLNAENACGGTGGVTYGSDTSTANIFLGSGGGSGGTDNVITDNPPGGAGGAGGGAILLRVGGTLTVHAATGSIDASGDFGIGDGSLVECTTAAANAVQCYDFSGTGGGGSGGSVLVDAGNVVNSSRVMVPGGAGGNGGSATGFAGDGGAGGAGRKWLNELSACALLKRVTPATATGLHNVNVDPAGATKIDAYCDMTFDGGGWTLIMDTNALNPSAMTTGVVEPSSGKYMPIDTMKAIAAFSRQVHVRTLDAAATASVTSYPTTVPIFNLRDGLGLNHPGRSDASEDFFGPYSGPRMTPTDHLWYTCTPSNGAWPQVYHACNNGNGLHFGGDAGRWTPGGANDKLQVWVR